MAERRSPHSPAATSAASTAATFPAARIYAAVLPFTSASFLALSAFTPWLEVDVKKSYPEASPDDVAKMVASRSALFSFSHGVCSVCIAGWAGMLSDRFGRRICASLPAMGQAVGYSLLALVVWYDLGVYYALAAWTLTGALGGTFVFLAAAFAYIADFTRSGGRGRAFSRLDSIMLYVACIGPLFSGPLVAAVGYAGVWALAAGMYALAALLFATAPPSPQPAAPQASLGAWVHSFTPLLLLRLVSERRGQLLGLVLAFLLATGGVQAGVQGFVLYAQRYLGWGQDMLGLFSALFSALGATLILFVHPIACRLLGSAPSDLGMVRAAYLLPLAYFAALAALPSAATEAAALGGLPLLAAGACALPHFRALFSASRPAQAQGEQMAVVAALESLPMLYATPLVSLAFERLLGAPRLIFLLPLGTVGAAILLLLAAVRPAALLLDEPPRQRWPSQAVLVRAPDLARRLTDSVVCDAAEPEGGSTYGSPDGRLKPRAAREAAASREAEAAEQEDCLGA